MTAFLNMFLALIAMSDQGDTYGFSDDYDGDG